MANLDFASTQTTIPKATGSKMVGSKKHSITRWRRSSSEYDDSSLDDFFSPTRPASTIMTGIDSPTVGTGFEPDDDFDRIIGSSNTQPSNKIQGPFASPVTKTLGQKNIFSHNAAKLSSFGKENTQTQTTYDRSFGSGPETTLTKRKVEPLSDATNIGNASKRPKIDVQPSTDQRHDDPYFINEPSAHSVYQSGSQEENIDELLLQEFGDIVNFSGI